MIYPGAVTVVHGMDGARAARGSVVIIDVFRFSTTVITLLGRGAARVVVAGDPADLDAMWPRLQSPVVFSELDLPVEHSDNSPTAARRADLEGGTAVCVSSNGSRALRAAADEADEVLVGGFANATALAEYVLATRPSQVTLVAAGLVARGERAAEDDVFAACLQAVLSGKGLELPAFRRQIVTHPTVQAYMQRAPVDYLQDVHVCLTLDAWSVVPRLDSSSTPPALISVGGPTAPSRDDGAPVTIIRRVRLPLLPDRVWAALVEPERRAAWWGRGIELRAQPGGRFSEAWKGSDGARRLTVGEVWVADPGRRLTLTWADDDWPRDTLLVLDLEECKGETDLILSHSGWEGLPQRGRDGLISAHSDGWDELLRRLRGHLAHSAPQTTERAGK